MLRAVAGLCLLSTLVSARSASAVGTVTVSSAFTAVANMTDADLPDFVVSGYGPSDVVLASVAIDDAEAGTSLSFPSHTGLTLKFGYSSWTGVLTVAFSGSQSDVNAALAAMTVTTGATAGVPKLSVSVALDDTTVALNPLNGHFYKYVASSNIHWTAAQAAAEAETFRGWSGYLVTITDADENAFVTAKIQGATNVWIGASDQETEGRWKWMGGPEDGQVFWEASCVATPTPPCGGVSGTSSYSSTSSIVAYNSWDYRGEPNNSYLSYGEDYAVTNWFGGSGNWNDIYNAFSGPSGYVIEFSGGDVETFTTATLTLDGSSAVIGGGGSGGSGGGGTGGGTGGSGATHPETGFSPWMLTGFGLMLIGAGALLEGNARAVIDRR